jgi:hypothetical protein
MFYEGRTHHYAMSWPSTSRNEVRHYNVTLRRRFASNRKHRDARKEAHVGNSILFLVPCSDRPTVGHVHTPACHRAVGTSYACKPTQLGLLVERMLLVRWRIRIQTSAGVQPAARTGATRTTANLAIGTWTWSSIALLSCP